MRSAAILTTMATAALAAGPALAGDFSFQVNLGIGRPAPIVVSGPVPASASVVVPVAVTVPAPAVAVTALWNSQPVGPLSGGFGAATYFQIDVPAGQAYLNVLTAGSAGDCDLYLARGYLPSLDRYDHASRNDGTEEELSILLPEAGTWYVLLYGFRGYADVSLLGAYWRQEVYAPAPDYGAYGTYDSPRTNVQVVIDWERHGYVRRGGGLLQFLLGWVRDRHEVRHHTICRPPVVVARPPVIHHPPVVVAPPPVIHHPPVVVAPPPVIHHPPVVVAPPPVIHRAPVVVAPPPVVHRPPVTVVERPGGHTAAHGRTTPMIRTEPPAREAASPAPPTARGASRPGPVRPEQPARAAPPQPAVRALPQAAPRPAPERDARPIPSERIRQTAPAPAQVAAPAPSRARGQDAPAAGNAETARLQMLSSLRERLQRAGR